MKRCVLHCLFHNCFSLLSPFVIVLFCSLFLVTNTYGQGELVARKLGTTGAAFGYYEYLPKDYNNKSKHPVLIFLSGIGERGNGTSDLDKVLKQGPPKLIKKGEWPSNRPFIVIAPQVASGFFAPDALHSFINYIIKKYRADANRIYLTGLSAGGISTWDYLEVHQDQIAAAIPICGNGKSAAKKAGCDFNNLAIWAFHGSSDPTINVAGSILAVENINACSPKPKPLAKLTVYPGVGHDSWSRTYDLSGLNSKTDGKYDPYNISIYDWLLKHSKDGLAPPPDSNQPPVADAGEDISVSPSTSKVVLNGSSSYDSDGKIVSYSWKKVSGPSASLSSASSSQLTVKNLSAGTYNFQLTVKDNDGDTNADNVLVTVGNGNPGSGSGNGVSYKYYEGNWSKLPDFSGMKVVKSGKLDYFDLSPHNRNDKFAFVFEGYVKIDKAGDYKFICSSDDGSKLYIDNKVVVDNDGVHGKQWKVGKVKLSTGLHAIKVCYFNKSGSEYLMVKYTGPGISRQYIPKNKLFVNDGGSPSEDTPATPPPSTDAEQVSKLYVINPGNNQRVGELKAGSKVVLGSGFNIEAVAGQAGSVKFLLDGKNYRVENVAPYALGGDNNGNFGSVKLSVGTHTLKVIPYSGSKAKGAAGEAVEIKFKVVKGNKVGVNAREAVSEEVIAKNIEAGEVQPGEVRPGEARLLGVYPNPFGEQIRVRMVNVEAAGEIECRLMSAIGESYGLSAADVAVVDGALFIDVSRLSLSAGVYLLQVTFNQHKEVFRILKE